MPRAAIVPASDVPVPVRASIDALGERHGRPAISPTIAIACRNVGDQPPKRFRGGVAPTVDFLLITPEWFITVREGKSPVAVAWTLRGAEVRRVRESTGGETVTGVQITGLRPEATERQTGFVQLADDEAGGRFLEDLIARTAEGPGPTRH